MHRRAMWPIHGKYICPQCLREFPVVWDGDRRLSSAKRPVELPTMRETISLVTPGPLVSTVPVADSYQSSVR